MHGSTLLRGKLAICHHRLTKHSSCGKLSERIDIAAVSSLFFTTDSPNTRRVARTVLSYLRSFSSQRGPSVSSRWRKREKGRYVEILGGEHSTCSAGKPISSFYLSIDYACVDYHRPCLPGLLVLHFYQRRRIVLSFVEFWHASARRAVAKW